MMEWRDGWKQGRMGETPGGSAGKGNGAVDGGGRDERWSRKKCTASLRRGQTILDEKDQQPLKS